MEPILHSSYSEEQAVAAFGGNETCAFLCDRQFIVLSSVVICMVTIGDPATQSHVVSRSTIEWRPGRLDYDPSDEYPWLPEQAREVWGPDRKKTKDHYVFLRARGSDSFVYAGKAHLGSYGGPTSGGSPADRSASFFLEHTLPRDVWLNLGGYDWLVEVNHVTQQVTKGDLLTFEKLTGQLLDQEFSHMCLTRYEEDSLTLHTNARRGWLMYLRTPGDSGLYVRTQGIAQSQGLQEVFRCECGIDLEFSVENTLPRDLAITATVEFFKTGDLPKFVEWELG